MPCRDIKLLRAVIRIDVTADMIEDLVQHITEVGQTVGDVPDLAW